MTITIHPTHTCFDDAVEILMLATEHGAVRTGEFVIVHAIVEPPGEVAMAHAWVEHPARDRALFIGIVGDAADGRRDVLMARRSEYRAELGVRESTSYTLDQAIREELRTGQCGPWEAKYQRLCRNQEELEGARRELSELAPHN